MRHLLLGLCILACACGPNTSNGDDTGGPDAGGDSCSGSETRCSGQLYQSCVDGTFQTTQTCTTACNIDLGGCVACDPNAGNTCNGTDVVACNADGTLGGVIMSCDTGQTCSAGQCTRACTADGVDLIYVVDTANEFMSFDPRKLGTPAGPFTVIANPLNCPAGTPYPSWPTSQPFSMSVDRDGFAWVLYTSGQIFKVDVTTGVCSDSGFTASQENGAWKLFGMGYSTDVAMGNTEKLFITGGPEQPAAQQMFGYVDPSSLAIQDVGQINAGTQSPELTGTGDAKLYGYFPGTTSFVQEIDKTTGHVTGNAMTSDPLVGDPGAWAFAQWGGKFYIFVTDSATLENMVQRVDRASGANDGTIIHNSTYEIVGAGVSTCAPVVVM